MIKILRIACVMALLASVWPTMALAQPPAAGCARAIISRTLASNGIAGAIRGI